MTERNDSQNPERAGFLDTLGRLFRAPEEEPAPEAATPSPLESLANAHAIEAVVVGGVHYDREQLDDWLAGVEDEKRRNASFLERVESDGFEAAARTARAGVPTRRWSSKQTASLLLSTTLLPRGLHEIAVHFQVHVQSLRYLQPDLSNRS